MRNTFIDGLVVVGKSAVFAKLSLDISPHCILLSEA